MIRSMTGFGRGEAHEGDVTVTVECKAVNHRFLDVAPRLPRELAALEGDVVRLVKERLRRGRVDVTVRRVGPTSGAVVVDEALFRAWIGAVDRLLVGRSDAERAAGVAHVLAQPGVLASGAAEVDAEAELPLVLRATDAALSSLQAMRAREGAALADDLLRHVGQIEVLADDVTEAVADLGARLREKLEARMARLLGEHVEPWRIAQEAALSAEKADVSEELARLRSHVDQVRAALSGDDAVGRRLDFLIQELGREVNTLGSKAVEHPVHHRVVELKTVLERLREQAANVE